MSALQSSFNSNRHWTGERLSGALGYVAKLSILQAHIYPWARSAERHIPANQFLGLTAVAAPAERATRWEEPVSTVQAKPQHAGNDYLMLQLLVFFFAYVVCKVML